MRRMSCAATAKKCGRFCQRGCVLSDKLKIRLVDERGGLQGVPLSFAAHIIVRQAMQFGLHQRNQLIERGRVSAAPVHEKLRDLLLR